MTAPDDVRAFFWTVRLAYHLRRLNWAKSIREAYSWAADECWQEYRKDGFTPMEAIAEDASYAQ